MKKFLAFMLVLTLCAALLTGCGGGGNKQPESTAPAGNEEVVAKPEVAGEVFDAGNVQVLVPEGWKAFPQGDVFSEDPDATDPDAVTLVKGGETDLDLLTKPSVRVDYFGPDTERGDVKDWYENVEDLEPLQCGPYTWEGFTTTDYGLNAILAADDGDHQYQVSVFMEADDGSISLSDEDVLAIIASVVHS